MRFRGVNYYVKTTTERGVWIWEIQPPWTNREGKFTGTREQAASHAKRLLWEWCYRHSSSCAKPTDEEILYENMMLARQIPQGQLGRLHAHARFRGNAVG